MSENSQRQPPRSTQWQQLMGTDNNRTVHRKRRIALLLATAVLPGIGQLVLGKKTVGVILITLAGCSLLGMAFSIVRFFCFYFSSIIDLENLDELPGKILRHLVWPAAFFTLFAAVWVSSFVHILRCRK